MNRTPIDDATFAQVADHFQYDANLPLESAVIGAWSARLPYVIEKVEYASVRGERVPAYFYHPLEEVEGPHPTVLLLHGANDFWGKNEDWAMEWSDILARQNWCVLCADNPGHGERKKAGQSFVFEMDTYTQRDHVVQTIIDQRRGIDYLLSRPEVGNDRIALMGGSLGGYYGAILSGVEDRMMAVVLTVTSAWPEGEATDDPAVQFGHTLNFAPRISAPTLMVNAAGDGREEGEELFNVVPEPKQQIWHESNHYLPPSEYNEDILAWLGERFNL
jgi:pimeloyl-ACP methyl ester carboxylesterase